MVSQKGLKQFFGFYKTLAFGMGVNCIFSTCDIAFTITSTQLNSISWQIYATQIPTDNSSRHFQPISPWRHYDVTQMRILTAFCAILLRSFLGAICSRAFPTVFELTIPALIVGSGSQPLFSWWLYWFWIILDEVDSTMCHVTDPYWKFISTKWNLSIPGPQH